MMNAGKIISQGEIEEKESTYYKVQMAFDREVNLSDFNEETIVNKSQQGSIVTLIVKQNKEDIEENIKNDKPELVVDRLHTFASEYLRNLCHTHSIETTDSKGNEYPLHSLAGMLKKWYVDNAYFDSEFAVVAIQNSINLFDKFNGIRNDNSAAHPNDLLSKAEAEYAVRIIANTLTFLDKCEKSKIKKVQTLPWDGGVLYIAPDEELPF